MANVQHQYVPYVTCLLQCAAAVQQLIMLVHSEAHPELTGVFPAANAQKLKAKKSNRHHYIL
jgi:hypothetical protein